MKEQPKQPRIERRIPENQEERELTVDRAAKLFFLSYRFSQGDTRLQKRVLQFVGTTYPEWRPDDAFLDSVKEKIEPMLEKYLRSRKGASHTDVAGSAKAAVKKDFYDERSRSFDSFQNAFTGEREELEDLLPRLTVSMLERDMQFIKLGRPGSERIHPSEMERYQPQKDKYFSYVCYYGLLGNSTGSEVYDEMFRQIAGIVRESWPLDVDEIKERFSLGIELARSLELDSEDLVEEWNETHHERHPDMQINVEDATSER